MGIDNLAGDRLVILVIFCIVNVPKIVILDGDATGVTGGALVIGIGDRPKVVARDKHVLFPVCREFLGISFCRASLVPDNWR